MYIVQCTTITVDVLYKQEHKQGKYVLKQKIINYRDLYNIRKLKESHM